MSVDTIVRERRLGPAPDETLNSRKILEQDICTDAMLDSLLGPTAICSWHGDDIDITRFNQQFCDEVKVTYFRELIHSLQRYILDEDRSMMYRLLEQAVEDRANGAGGVVRFQRPDGTVSQYRVRFYFIGEDANGKNFYGTARDLTHFVNMDDHMRLLSQIAPVSVVFLWRRGTEWSFRIALHGLEAETGLTGKEMEQELNDGRFEQRITPEVKQNLKKLILSCDMRMERFSEPFDATAKDGRTLQLQIRFNRVHDESTGVEYVLIIRKYGKGI